MTVEEAKYSSREVSGLRPPPNPAQICEHVASLHKLNQGLGPALPGHSWPGLSLLAQVTLSTAPQKVMGKGVPSCLLGL